MHVLHCGRMPDHPEREPMEAWGEHANTTQRWVSWLAEGWQKKNNQVEQLISVKLVQSTRKHRASQVGINTDWKTRVAEAGIIFDCRHGFKE